MSIYRLELFEEHSFSKVKRAMPVWVANTLQRTKKNKKLYSYVLLVLRRTYIFDRRHIYNEATSTSKKLWAQHYDILYYDNYIFPAQGCRWTSCMSWRPSCWASWTPGPTSSPSSSSTSSPSSSISSLSTGSSYSGKLLVPTFGNLKASPKFENILGFWLMKRCFSHPDSLSTDPDPDPAF